jgi:hypothetical protein
MSPSGFDQGCVKTCTREESAELFSLFSSFDGDDQSGSCPIQPSRGKRPTRKLDVGVFTQPWIHFGSLETPGRFSPESWNSIASNQPSNTTPIRFSFRQIVRQRCCVDSISTTNLTMPGRLTSLATSSPAPIFEISRTAQVILRLPPNSIVADFFSCLLGTFRLSSIDISLGMSGFGVAHFNI